MNWEKGYLRSDDQLARKLWADAWQFLERYVYEIEKRLFRKHHEELFNEIITKIIKADNHEVHSRESFLSGSGDKKPQLNQKLSNAYFLKKIEDFCLQKCHFYILQ